MASKGFTLIELVVLALLLGIIAVVALPNFRESLLTFTASEEKAFIASMTVDLLRLAVAEEDYYRDSLKYTTILACTSPATPGTRGSAPRPATPYGGWRSRAPVGRRRWATTTCRGYAA